MSRSTIIMRANLELARRVEEQWPFAAIAQLCDEHEALEARLATAERELEQLRGWKQIIDGVEHDSGALIGWMERATTAERELAEAREWQREALEWVKQMVEFEEEGFVVLDDEDDDATPGLDNLRDLIARADAQEGE